MSRAPNYARSLAVEAGKVPPPPPPYISYADRITPVERVQRRMINALTLINTLTLTPAVKPPEPSMWQRTYGFEYQGPWEAIEALQRDIAASLRMVHDLT